MSTLGVVGGTAVAIVGVVVVGSVATAYIWYAGITGAFSSIRNATFELPSGVVLEKEK